MKKSSLLMMAAALGTAPGRADVMEADTLRQITIEEEAVVVASPKETALFRNQPISASIFGREALLQRRVESVKGLAAYAPNFFMPDYGSRLTSAAYIRGVGSRIGTPAVGLYVDNVPVVDKTAYDFSFIDVSRVDVLRGPQATLYGRNAMGGIVRVFTADPFTHMGTDVQLSAESRTLGRSVKAVTYLHPSTQWALSLGGFYEGENGFFRNTTTGKKADGAAAAGGKMRAAWRPSSALRVDLTATYEYSDEDACPYTLTEAGGVTASDEWEGAITQNRSSSYRRETASAGMGLEWQAPHFVLSSITSYRYLRDRFFMDQDFVKADIFSLTQRQRMNTVTQELTMKSRPGRRWQWTQGAFFMHQTLKTACPVVFYQDGVSYLNNQLSAVLPSTPRMTLAFTGETLPFGSRLSTPTTNAALFHQSTVDLGAGLSAVAGVRVDYDHTSLRLNAFSEGDMSYDFSIFGRTAAFVADPSMTGHLNHDSWQVLPKVALQYQHRSGRGNVYLSVSKGYRAGGYNIQSYSDLAQTALRRSMMLQVRDYSVATIEALPLPDASKQAALAGVRSALTPQIPAAPDVSSLSYAPEQSWNYELGGHLKFPAVHLLVDYSFFYMNTKDQQLARFSDSGLGRVSVNAGRTRNYGAELSLRSALLDERLQLTASYGFSDARFTRYDLGVYQGEAVDYKGHRVPFAPRHTLGATAAFRQPLHSPFWRAVGVSAQVNGAGSVYWDEANTFSQPFYATLGATLSAEVGRNVSLSLWGRNLTGVRYATFAFESLQNRFAQYGHPRSFGVAVRLHF
jgi:outer membrane receptor protein involved in Fe transport